MGGQCDQETPGTGVGISVIIPVCNAAPYLRACLDSVLCQGTGDVEIICIDDGSTDASAAVLADIASRDPRVRVVRQANAGQGAARNRGLELARGEYVYFMDADDELADREALARLVAEMNRERLDVLFFDAETRVDEGVAIPDGCVRAEDYIRRHGYPGVLCGRELFAAFLKNREYTVSPCLMMLRRSFVDVSALRFPDARFFYEDNIFMTRVLLAAKRAGHRPWRFYVRKVHAGSTVTSEPTMRHLRGYLACHQDACDLVARGGWDRETLGLLKGRKVRYALQVVKMSRRLEPSGDDLRLEMSEGELEAYMRLMGWNPILRILTAAWCCFQDRGLSYTFRRAFCGKGGRRTS